MSTRPLTLHASALSNEEYTLYTTSLIDLAGEDEQQARSHGLDDSYYAALKISAREARAWIRGRYTDLPHSNVDAVLKLFCPNLGVADLLSGGQFFAALRLVTHIRQGKPLDGNLVFVQAHPEDATSTISQEDKPSSDSRLDMRDLDTALVEADTTSSRSLPSRPVPPPKPALTPSSAGAAISSTNPFINRSKSQPPSHPPSLSQPQPQSQLSGATPPLPPRKPSQPPPPPPRHSSLSSANPVIPPSQPPTTPSAFAFWHNHSQPGSTPTNPNVLIQQSLQAGRIAQSLKKAEQKLEKERVLEVLKRSSKSGGSSGSIRNRSESPSKDASGFIGSKALSLASSASASGSASASSDESHLQSRPSTRASSATVTVGSRGPALPPRRSSRRTSPPPSSTGSTWSFEQVAHASVSGPRSATRPRTESPFAREQSLEREERKCSPPPQHPDLLPQPPPTHPDRKLHGSSDSNAPSDQDPQTSPTGRVFRSKSMHYSTPPVPPPRRKRPESVQYANFNQNGVGMDRTPSPTRTDRSSRSLSTVFSSPASIPSRGGPGNVSRHMSLSLNHRRRESQSNTKDGSMTPNKDDSSPIANIKNTLMGLQPRLDAARYKAEAGLSRRGYVNHGNSSLFKEEGEERLVSLSGASSLTDVNSLGGASIDSDDESGLGQDVSILDTNDSDEGSKGPVSSRTGGERWNGKKSDDAGRGRSSSSTGLGGELEGRKPKRPWEVERDEMKWPTGDGWKPL